MRVMSRLTLIAIATALGCSAAFAQSAPQGQASNADALTALCSSFIGQAGGVSGDHKKLCDCLTRETPEQLSTGEMSLYQDATLSNQAAPDAIVQKMTAIATKCLKEAQ
jgi:hypothetical protein